MPYLNLQNVLCYNKDMFRECGLDAYISDKDGNKLADLYYNK